MDLSFLTILRRLFTRRDKKIIGTLLIASILVSIVETIGVSAVMVFVSVATNFGAIQNNFYFSKAYLFLGCSQPRDFILILGFVLLLFYGFRMILNAVHIYYTNKFSQMRQHHFATRMFHKFLLLNYKDFVTKNPAKMHQIIIGYSANVTQIISAILSIFAESLTVACIYVMLFIVNWKMTLVLTFLLSAKILFIIKLFSGRIRAAGKKSQKFSLMLGKAYSETYGNYKFLKLLADEGLVRDRFSFAGKELAQANTINTVWQALPRYVLETIGFSILISVMLYVIYRYNNASSIIPIVSMYALAFYRFLPSVNKIMMGYNQIMFNKHVPKPIYEFLQYDFEKLENKAVSFNHCIKLEHVAFAYTEKSRVFFDATLTIFKGHRVGFIGESGAGKSTIADIVMGLFSPDKGSLFVDSQLITTDQMRAWRKKIGYIPQSIYLFDGSVANNITCGRPFEKHKVITALKMACIYDFLLTKDGIETIVGEGGIRFSGGQKQRIAIARALYDDPEVLVLDEATSSLDNETEEDIMNEIYVVSRNKTLIIIAHRLTTIEQCDKIYKIYKGTVYDVSKEYCKNVTIQKSVSFQSV
jgi:ATP-binding cassette, subfamily B, bacterial PglK